MSKRSIQSFIIYCANNLLKADLDEKKCNIPIFSQSLNITPWGVIHLLDEINKKYNIVLDVADLAVNPDLTIDDIVNSTNKYLLANNLNIATSLD